MRNLLLALLLANILYFIWGLFSGVPEEPGVVIVDESDLGPPMQVTVERDSEIAASVGAVLGSGQPSALEAVVGRACVTIGPFRQSDDADKAQVEYAGEGMRTDMRSTIGQIFVGHWVLVANIPDAAARNEMLTTLQEGGLPDSYGMQSEDTGLGISLGLFGEIEGAERVELQAKSLGVPAEIRARMTEGSIYYVDVALPPGKGAGAIVDKYGEDRVLLRDAATCPQSG